MSSNDLGQGDELGAFRIGRRLGIGGMGLVFQALDTNLNRQVALKIITPHIAEDPEFRARFTREAQAQASLDSPHVVQVYSFGEADGRLYIASQLIPDGDLGAMLHRHGAPPARIALDLIAQVADGLSAAHESGLIHRDIKPANVLLRNRESRLHAYLGDFGIARQANPEQQITKAGGTVGTPSYMAPELHMGGDANQQTDVYSLGCLLWAALTGSAPFSGGTDYQIVLGHVDGPIPQLDVAGPLSAEVNRVVRTSLAKSSADRYPSAAAMRDDLRRVVRLPEDAETRLAGPPGPGSPWLTQGPRTPTPTPSGPVPTPAPPAPPFRTPTPSGPHTPFRTGPTFGATESYPSGAPGGQSRRTRLLLMIALAVSVVVIGVSIVVAVLASNGDDGGGGSGGGGGGEPTREEQAVDELAAAFAEDEDVPEEGGRCIAQEVVDQAGVDKLVEEGVLNEDLEYQPDTQIENTTLAGTFFGAVFSCTDELGLDESASGSAS